MAGGAPDGAFSLNDVKGATVVATPASGEKCDRCWRVLEEVKSRPAHICDRCFEAVESLPA